MERLDVTVSGTGRLIHWVRNYLGPQGRQFDLLINTVNFVYKTSAALRQSKERMKM